MEMQQMMELLLKEIRATREDFLAIWDADRKAQRGEMAAWQEKMDAETEAIRRETAAI
jgi:hypothetical protein